MSDNVNHPQHYQGTTSLECIDVMKAIFGAEAVYDFCVCNAFKYLWRMDEKGGSEDIKKAEWYCDYAEKLFAGYDEVGHLSDLRDMIKKAKKDSFDYTEEET